MNKRLAIITTHPIQYHAPLFSLLTSRNLISIKVFYTWGEGVLKDKFDPGFGQVITWDIPLLTGYDYTFVNNAAADPGSHHFSGIDNPTLIEEINDWKPDALLIYGWNFKSHLKMLRHFAKRTKILFRGDSTLLDESEGMSVKKSMRRLFLAWVYKHIDTALYVGKANKNYFASMGLKPSQLVFAPHAIENSRFEKTVDNFRATLNIHVNAIVLLFAGKLESKKNPELLLQSFIEMENNDAHLMIVGNGMLEASLKNTTLRLPESLKSRIHFVDFRNQLSMPAVYHAADIFVLPSQGPDETWGLAVNEAMAAGNAVLVSDKCGCSSDLVENNINGFIFKSNNLNDLQNKIRLICNDRLKLQKMRQASREKIRSWSFEIVAQAIEKSVVEIGKLT